MIRFIAAASFAIVSASPTTKRFSRQLSCFFKKNDALSLQDVADVIYISPTYHSIIFKKEKNITFSDFLLKTRMEEAMRLLRMKDLKTYEVAVCVGYGNPQLSPSEFKQSNT